MSDLTVKIKGDGDYPLDVDATLADLTGTETAMLEDYLGGWQNFGHGTTRGLIVTIWLAKRQAGKAVSLEEIAEMKGLVFGDAVAVDEAAGVNGGPPAEAASAATPSTEPDSVTYGVGV